MDTNHLDLKSQKGFTLIELMVVVAIIGILTSIAYPSYLESVAKSRRADTKGNLLVLANAMERYFTENNTYLGAAGTAGSPADTGAPRIFAAENLDYYTITISAATATSYTLSAARVSGSAQENDICGTFNLTQTGAKSITGSGSHCW